LKDTEALLPLLKEAKREKANLFIIADEYDPDVLNQLVLSKIRSGVSVCAIKAPHYKDMRYDSMIDISILMGGTFIDPYGENPIALEDVRLRHCGRCDKVICSLYKTSFSGFGNIADAEKKAAWKAALDARIADIKDLANDNEAEKLPRENAKLRLKQINAKAAIISLGASSEVEYQEKLDRADDALRAVRCAMTEGIVPGAGYSYLKATKCKGLTTLLKSTDDGEKVGAKIVQKALTVPFKKLLSNAGMEDEVGGIMDKVINGDKGYNLKTKKLENLIESGVIDPWQVTKSALRNAGSVAGLILTSEAIVSDEDELKAIDVSEKLPTL
jgi:chaperonin GroEL